MDNLRKGCHPALLHCRRRDEWNWDEIIENTFKDTQATTFDARYSKIGDRGVKHIALGLSSSHITTLNLRACEIGNEGIESLAKGISHSKVTSLTLIDNNIENKGAECLAGCLKHTLIKSLDLRRNKIGALGAKHLADGFKDAVYLRYVCLAKNGLGDEGASYIANVLKYTKITKLDLKSNGIKYKGAEYIANGLEDSQVHTLNLKSNRIGDKGAEYLAKSIYLKNTRVISLDLSATDMSSEGAMCISRCIANTLVTIFKFKLNRVHSLVSNILESVLQDNKNIINKICDNFKLLVSNDTKHGLQFTLGQSKVINDNDYLIFISNVHHFMYGLVPYFMIDPDIKASKNEIVRFIGNISIEFSEFLSKNAEIDNLEYVNLLKKCEIEELHLIVEGLLLNRGFCFIQNLNKKNYPYDILYPYVYLLLHKYKQPLIPNHPSMKCNTEEIIQYFEDHPELEYSREAVKLLKNLSTNVKKTK